MSALLSTAISDILARVRDPSATAHSRALVRELLSEAQRLVNGGLRSVIDSASLTTSAGRQVYAIEAALGSALRITGVRDAGRDLVPVDWRCLDMARRDWWRRVAPQHQVFSLVGRDLLLLHPAKDADSTVTVFYVKKTAAFTAETDRTELPDGGDPALLDLVEALLLLRGRRLDALGAPMKRLATALGVEVATEKAVA